MTDLFAYARDIYDVLVGRGVRFDDLNGLATIDLRACGSVEILGTESGAYLRFAGPQGELRVILSPGAFFSLSQTFTKGLP